MQRQISVFVSGLIMGTVLAMSLPNAVEAQEVLAPTDNVRVGTVIGVGTTQTLNLYIQYNMHRGTNQGTNQQSEPRIQGVTILLQNPNPDTENEEVCTQTIQALTNFVPGLNTLSLGITSDEDGGNKRLLLNGVEPDPPLPPIDDCFDETNRIIYMVGEITAIEPNFSESLEPVRGRGGIMLWDVTDPSGATAASGETGLFDGGTWFLDINQDLLP